MHTQTHAMRPSSHPFLDAVFGLGPERTLNDVRAVPLRDLHAQGLVDEKRDELYSTEDNKLFPFHRFGFYQGGFHPIPLEAGVPKVPCFHPYHGRFCSCAPARYPAFIVYDAARLLIAEDSLNEQMRIIAIGHDRVHKPGPVSLYFVIQTNPFSKPGTVAKKDFSLPKGMRIGQQIPGAYTEMLFRPQYVMENHGERSGQIKCYVRSLLGPSLQRLPPAKLVGGSEQHVVLHAAGNASPCNLHVHSIVPSGESHLVGSGLYWYPGSVGVVPHSCHYGIYALLGPQDAEVFYQMFFDGTSGIQRARTFREVWEAVFALPRFRGNVPPEVADFILHEIGDRPQQ
ncbi:MAG: hypothetical protein LBD15_01865 [Holosporales bacterium]|nr:hypothetical protein [Holosporales bacterium]